MLAIASTVVTKVALGHDAGVAAILVAEHGAVGGHGHSRQHHGHREHESRRHECVEDGPDDGRHHEQTEHRAGPEDAGRR